MWRPLFPRGYFCQKGFAVKFCNRLKFYLTSKIVTSTPWEKNNSGDLKVSFQSLNFKSLTMLGTERKLNKAICAVNFQKYAFTGL